jgi:hypothetical protein
MSEAPFVKGQYTHAIIMERTDETPGALAVARTEHGSYGVYMVAFWDGVTPSIVSFGLTPAGIVGLRDILDAAITEMDEYPLPQEDAPPDSYGAFLQEINRRRKERGD